MVVDVSGIAYFAPIWSFLIVWAISYAVFAKTKIIGENNTFIVFVAFVIASIFVTVGGLRQYVLTVVPWAAVLIVSAAFVLALMGFVGSSDSVKKGAGLVLVVIFAIVFLVSGIFVYSSVIGPYLPGSSMSAPNSDIKTITDWLYSGRVSGAVLLIIASAVVSWILLKTGAAVAGKK